MIDFIVNIKNKKNMTKFNIKTFVATSVLCVFFNGAAIYGMKEKKGEKGEEKETVLILENNDDKGEEKLKTEEGEKELEDKDKSGTNKLKDIKMEPKVKKLEKNIQKNIQKNIFLNYRGNYSLLFCCNLCNNKEANMNEFLKEQNALELKELIEKEDYEHDNGTTIIKEKKE